LATLLANALVPIAGHIRCALVFGSVARGQETAHSDVDILVLGDISFADVIEALHPAQEQVRREINPVVHRLDDFRAKLASNNTWARDVVKNPKFFLIGDADDFAELVKNPEPGGVQNTA
jgi:predicted nucleotidyltransferase